MTLKQLSLLMCFFSVFSFSQAKDTINNTKYLEDQLYLGLNYNIIDVNINDFDMKGLSNSIALGYIRDIPFNKQRNFGIGIGLGYGRSTYYQNLKIFENNNKTVFESLGATPFDKNKFSFHAIEMPFEIRWRTSTASKYKFWRVYTGLKMSYIFTSNAVYKNGSDKSRITNFSEVNNFQYGITLSAGYGTWNLNLYYGLRDFFNNAIINNQALEMRDLRIGLIFYML